jgi:hypothetical protein
MKWVELTYHGFVQRRKRKRGMQVYMGARGGETHDVAFWGLGVHLNRYRGTLIGLIRQVPPPQQALKESS